MHLFRHNIDAESHFIISKCTYAALYIVVESMRARGLGPGKFRSSPGEDYAFWLVALFINVSNKIILLKFYI